MKPIYHHYETWEDYRNGMYNEDKNGRRERVERAKEILADTDLLYRCMKRVTTEWTHATEQNLSNNIYGHRSFLGQTACNICAGIKEDETREAWGLITEEQRREANKVADRVIEEWEKEQAGQHQMSLFEQ